MAVHRLSQVIQNLRRNSRPDEPSVSDGQLLDHFIERQDELAFATLVQRHGPMVWGVCRRIVAHYQDAEDAFQATFLVLARKATSIRPREMVANWLFGVAHRTALKARTMAGKRQAREKQVTTMPEPAATEQRAWENLESLIDQELAILPDKYRVAIVLCDLEGKKGKDVARQLKVPEGTLASRLRTGRVMLAKRLARHGVILSGGALATVLSQNAASACAPSVLVNSTIRAATLTAAGKTVAAGIISANAAALMEGVMKAMLLTKLKSVMTMLLVLGMLAFGGGRLITHCSEAGQHGPAPKPGEGEKPTDGTPIPRNEAVNLPRSSAPGPTQALVSLKNGQLVVRTLAVDSVTPVTKVVDGRNVTSYVVKEKVTTRNYDLSVVKVYDVKGKRIDVRELPKLLDKEIVALIAKDGVEVDPLHLRLVKGGTLLFLLPLPDAASPPLIAVPSDALPPPTLPAPPPPRSNEKPASSAEPLPTKNGKVQKVTYQVADLVVPIGGLDDAPISNKNEDAKTKEDWLINKVTRTVSPDTWKGAGGTGTIQYSSVDMSLVVNNSPRVQAQVKYLLETMRRVQDVQVAAEIRILSLNAACFLKLQALLPQLKKDGHAVLSDAETFALLRKAQDDANTKVMQAPKITFFPGQRVGFSMDPNKDLPGIKTANVQFNALVAANLQHLELEVKATVGKVGFTKAIRLEDGVTLAQFKRNGDGYVMFLVTPRVILSLEDAVAAPE